MVPKIQVNGTVWFDTTKVSYGEILRYFGLVDEGSLQFNGEDGLIITNAEGFYDLNYKALSVPLALEIGGGIAEYGEAYVEYYKVFDDLSYVNFEDHFFGEFEDFASFAYEVITSTGDVPSYVLPYVDLERFAIDSFDETYIYSLSTAETIFVFNRVV